ncbi:VanZ family protein [Streptomyces sp. J2-1]|uniref:VanZ family protein n=1 Tax=Streptomyces corallincola TaxID=2851888 RepID=UPI001C3845CE|nr:VanZ family protein [Streptomyces corallincola]MBV2357265.1 VanZ family protein [Streptomyces corallincola]
MARTAPQLPGILRAPWARTKREDAVPERARFGWRGSRAARGADESTVPKRESAAPRRGVLGGGWAERRAERRALAAERKRAAEPRPLPLVIRVPVMLLAFVGMVVFAVALAKVTLVPSPASVPLTHSNLRPGSSVQAYLAYGQPMDTIKQIGGNVLLGVPFGILVPVLAPRARGMVRVVALTALVMLMVELVQGALVTGRAFDVDDVILNTTGALIGWLILGRRLGRAVHARKPRPVTE